MPRWVFVWTIGLGLLATGCQRCVRQRSPQPIVTAPSPIVTHRPAPVPSEPPEPAVASVPPLPPESTPAIESPVETTPPLLESPRSAVSPGCGPDHRWLVGRLQYLYVRDAWRIRYAAPESDDRYGGTLMLVNPGSMTAFHEGQLVRVEGRVVEPESREPSPAYQVHSIHAVP